MNVQGEPGSKGKGHGSLCPSMIACLPSRDRPPARPLPPRVTGPPEGSYVDA